MWGSAKIQAATQRPVHLPTVPVLPICKDLQSSQRLASSQPVTLEVQLITDWSGREHSVFVLFSTARHKNKMEAPGQIRTLFICLLRYTNRFSAVHLNTYKTTYIYVNVLRLNIFNGADLWSQFGFQFCVLLRLHLGSDGYTAPLITCWRNVPCLWVVTWILAYTELCAVCSNYSSWTWLVEGTQAMLWCSLHFWDLLKTIPHFTCAWLKRDTQTHTHAHAHNHTYRTSHSGSSCREVHGKVTQTDTHIFRHTQLQKCAHSLEAILSHR